MEYSAHYVRAKTRAAVKRREDAVEQDEMESGELNLIPYLDMVTNLMLFLLFSVSAGIILTQIDTTLPTQKKADAANPPPQVPPDEQPLKLFVSITRDSMTLWSVTGLEGTLKEPKPGYVFQRVGKVGDSCEGPHNCEQNSCRVETAGQLGKCVASDQEPTFVYDYRKLNDTLFEIAKRRYGTGKPRRADTYSIMLQADPMVPYSAIVATMSAMRCKFPAEGREPTLCALPDAGMKKEAQPVSADGKYYDTERAIYDPTKMALFHEIGFSSGFE